MKTRILLALVGLSATALLLFGCNNPDAVSRVIGSFGNIGGAEVAVFAKAKSINLVRKRLYSIHRVCIVAVGKNKTGGCRGELGKRGF